MQFNNIKRQFVFALLFLPIVAFFFLGSPLWADAYGEYVKKGRDYAGLFQFDKAKECFDKAITLDQTKPDAYFNLGLALRKLNQNDAALSAFESALNLDPDDLDCKKAVASLYIQNAKDQKQAGNREKMLLFLHKACVAYPQSTNIWSMLLEQWATDRKWKEITGCGDLIKKANKEALEAGDDQKLQSALITLAKAHKELNETIRAKEYLNAAGMIHHANDELTRLKSQIAQSSSQMSGSLLTEAQGLINKGNVKEAFEKLKQAQAANSGSSEVADLLEQTQKQLQILDFTKAADEAEAKENYEEALEKINAAIGFAEDDQSLRDRAASLSVKLEKQAEKLSQEKAVQLQKRQAQLDRKMKIAVFLKAAEKNEKKKSFDIALLNYQEALKLDKGNAEIQAAMDRVKKADEEAKLQRAQFSEKFEQAKTLYSEEKYDEAYAILKELADDPGNPKEKVLPLLIESCLKLGKLDDAGLLTGKLAAIKADSDEINYFTGYIAYQKGNYAAAKEPLQKLNTKNPGFRSDVSSMLWWIWFSKYQYGIYVVLVIVSLYLFKAFVKVLARLNKARINARIDRAISAGSYEKVIPLIESVLSDPGYSENRRQLTLALAEGYLRKGMYEQAHDRANEVFLKDTRNATAQRIIGECCFQLGERSSDSIEKIMNLFKMDESRKDVLSFLVTHFRAQQADHKIAIEAFQKQILLCPDDKETIFYIADLFLKRRNFAQGNGKVFDKAAKLDPEKPDYVAGQIQCLIVNGKRDEAARIMEKAKERWPNSDLFYSETPSRSTTPEASPRQTHEPSPRQTPEPPPRFIADTPPRPGSETPREGRTLKKSFASLEPAANNPTEPQFGLPSLPPLPPLPTSSPTSPIEGGISCKHCGASNHPREYYCTTCGKPLKMG